MLKIPCVYMRTGTSKSLYFKKEDLPNDEDIRDKYLLNIMGSPDVRQIDGMGGGDVSTSKIAIISKSKNEEYDVDYTFGQVSLSQALIDYSGNCGNCSSGVGPFAIDEGYVKAEEPITTVRIFNTNTKKLIVEKVRVKDGKALEKGDCQIDGVPGTGAPIDVDLKETVGATTGELFPTGNRQDILVMENKIEIPVTIADVGNPVVFFHASYVGASGYESRPEINSDKQLLERIEEVRQKAAEKIGLIKPGEIAKQKSGMKPLVVIFNQPKSYRDYVSGNEIKEEEIDFVAKNIMNQLCIDTFAVTAALNTGIVASITGTVLYEHVKPKNLSKGIISIGHSRGISQTWVRVKDQECGIEVEQAVIQRTARRIMEGLAYVNI